MICFKCGIYFEDIYDMVTICYVCRKYLCMACHNKHNHNNIETKCENLVDIIKEKNEALYKPIPICDWNTSFDIENAIMMNRSKVRQRCDFTYFHRQLINMKERFNYLFIEMIFKKYFVVTYLIIY